MAASSPSVLRGYIGFESESRSLFFYPAPGETAEVR